jgi:hypothetical protein
MMGKDDNWTVFVGKPDGWLSQSPILEEKLKAALEVLDKTPYEELLARGLIVEVQNEESDYLLDPDGWFLPDA